MGRPLINKHLRLACSSSYYHGDKYKKNELDFFGLKQREQKKTDKFKIEIKKCLNVCEQFF